MRITLCLIQDLINSVCNMKGLLVCVSVLPITTAGKLKENHTKISIIYKADWPIRSGYLLANSHILINSFF